MDVLQALRDFLAVNPLPPEAQQIDRIMQDFAANYWKNNPQLFLNNADTVYILCFAIIMLSTDLHVAAPQGNYKGMTKEQWKKQIRDQWNENDFPEEYLDGVYDSIKTNPLIIPKPPSSSPKQDQSISAFEADEGYQSGARKELLQDIESDDFETGLFDCFSDTETCLCACCCPCVQIGRNMEAIGEGDCLTWAALWFVLQWCSKAGCVVHFLERSKVRERLRMRPDPLMDFIKVSCCDVCALSQEAREIKSRRERLYRI